MLESLADLQLQLVEAGGRLLLLRGQPQELLPELLQQSGAQAVFVNRDFTPFSQQRDTRLQKVVKQQGAAWHSVDDLLLHPPENTRKADGNPYTVFTPFYRNAARLTVPLPEPLPKSQWGTSVLILNRWSIILTEACPPYVSCWNLLRICNFNWSKLVEDSCY